jgi:TRAP-type C4-dicarboxylate transport system substrate-binding protein
VAVLPISCIADDKPDKPVTLSFNWDTSYGRSTSTVWPFRKGGRFEQLVERHSEGMLKLDVKDKLYGLMESVFAIGDGRINMGTQSVPAASGTYPLLDFGSIPGLFSNPPAGASEWAAAFFDPEMMKIIEEYTRPAGFKIIGASLSLANEAIWSDKAIRKIEDFKGLKVRTSGRTQTMALRQLGASPVTLSMAEVEEALYRGTVDGITTAINYGTERGLIELCDHVSLWQVNPVFTMIIAVNIDVWDKLDPFYQNALLRAGQDLTNELAAVIEQIQITYTMWINSSGKTKMIKPEQSEIDKAMQLMEPVVKDWLKTTGQAGNDVLKVSLKYANGPAVGVVKGAVQ